MCKSILGTVGGKAGVLRGWRAPGHGRRTGKARSTCAFTSRSRIAYGVGHIFPAIPSRQGEGMRRDGWLSLSAAVGMIALAGVVAGCMGRSADVALPKKPGHARPARVDIARPSVRQLVVTAYEGYWEATNEAINSRSRAAAIAILTEYIPGSAVPGLVRGMRVLWRRDEVAFGAPIFHIVSVKMTGPRTAAVHDCIDLSHAGLQNRKTGAIVGGLGQSHDDLITNLAFENGRWLVTGAIPVVKSCV
jgi:hypothetical protein